MTELKTGLFLCDCNGALKHLEFDALIDGLPEGVPVELSQELCRPEEFARRAVALRDKGVNRIVVGACPAWASAACLGELVAEAGWDPGTALFVNLREQCAWAHDGPSGKAAMLVAAALARVEKRTWKRPAPREAIDTIAVLGSGPDAQAVMREVSSLGHPVVSVSGGLRSLTGGPGDFTVEVCSGDEVSEVKAGALVVATGSEALFSEEDHHLELGPRALSLSGLESILEGDDFKAVCKLRGLMVGFMVDVSAPDSVSTFSRAISMAGALQSKYACETYVFARDAKVAGKGLESLYRDARVSGVVFLKDEGEAPVVRMEGTKPCVVAKIPSLGEPFSGEPVRFPLDLLVLDERLCARDIGLSRVLGVGTWKGRFFQEENIRLFPIFTNRRGVWTMGGARGDVACGESEREAAVVACEVARYLQSLKDPRDPDDLRKAEVDPDKCARCLTCVRACPHNAISIEAFNGEERAAQVDEAACRGCGVCASLCPARAISFSGYSDEELYAELKVMGGWSL